MLSRLFLVALAAAAATAHIRGASPALPSPLFHDDAAPHAQPPPPPPSPAACETLIDGARLSFDEKLPKAMQLKAGQPLQLECSVVASPQASIIWLHNGVPIERNFAPDEEGMAARRLGIATVTGRLSLPCPASGEYTCMAIAPCSAAPIQQSTMVSAPAPPRAAACSAPAAPVLSAFTTSRMEFLHTPFVLMCRSNEKDAIVQWERLFDDESALSVASLPGFLQTKEGDLIAYGVEIERGDGKQLATVALRCSVTTAAGTAAEEMSVMFLDE